MARSRPLSATLVAAALTVVALAVATGSLVACSSGGSSSSLGEETPSATIRAVEGVSPTASLPAHSGLAAGSFETTPGATVTGTVEARLSDMAPRRLAPTRPAVVPSTGQFDRARAWAKQRHGIVAFATIDSRGRMRGYRMNEQFVSASVVKAMLLVAYLRSHPNPSRWAKATLTSMIVMSDNDAAASIYRMVGDAGLYSVARKSGMTHFSANGWWSLSQITPADQARFFYSMDRLIPKRDREFARHLLSHITGAQSWGVPKVARPQGWRVFFKGGWRSTRRGSLVHQAARLERDDKRVAIAVMTDGNPSESYGIATVRGIAERLLR